MFKFKTAGQEVRRHKIKFKKARSSSQVLNDLDEYIRAQGTEPVEWLAREVRRWGEFSYEEIEQAILDGRLDELIDWQSRYADLINSTLSAQWASAMKAAAAKATHGQIVLYDSDPDVHNWLKRRGGELITVLSAESKKAVANVILYGQSGLVNPKQIARQVRPLIGLNARQAQANINYRERIYQQYISNGVNPVTAAEKADAAAVKYAGKQHRFRAETITHTEMAFAYNQGADVGVKRAVKQGLMGRCEMVWTTAGTNRVCPRCLALKDTVVGHTDESGVTLPPLHPRCRCAIMYREIEAPVAEKPKKTFEEKVAAQRQKLESQRANGATAAEMEKTIQAAGKLVLSEARKTKIYDLPAGERIDVPQVQKTFQNFQRRIYNLPATTAAEIAERQELMAIYRQITNELSEIETAIAEETVKVQRGRAEQLKQILSQVRDMGAKKEQLKTQFGTSKSPTRKVLEEALNFYPSDWVEASVKRGKLKPQQPKSGRAYYDDINQTITVMPKDARRVETAIHEFGHRMEKAVKDMLSSETAFYGRRTAGEKIERLRDLTGNNGYDLREVTRKDKFIDFYMGKDYHGYCYELISMGFQLAYTDPEALWKDEDMAKWIYGLLAIL